MTNKTKKTHQVSLFFARNTAVNFDSFAIEYVPQYVLKKIKDKLLKQNIFRMQSEKSFLCKLYCIVFIEYNVTGKALIGLPICFPLMAISK